MKMKSRERSTPHGSGSIDMYNRILADLPSYVRVTIAGVALASTCLLVGSCTRQKVNAATAQTEAAPSEVTVGTVPVTTREMAQHLTLSSELVPFQEIDVYAKEAGYVKELYVDYGTHVQKGALMALLEIPELEAQLLQDDASITAQSEEINREEHEVDRAKAQLDPAHQQYDRLTVVAKGKPGLVAQQEVDDAQGKYLAAESQLEAVRGALSVAKSQLAMAKAKRVHDLALYSYAKITAPFDGVVTQRFANLGALMQAGTTSTQATPLVRLSQENLFRLVIPVPESYVKYIHVGAPVDVRVPSLGRTFKGTVIRFSVDVNGSTRTMHTEVDVPNASNQLVPGLYAEAVLTLDQKGSAIAVPLQAVNREGDKTSVFVVSANNRIEDRPIVVGIQTPNYVEVVSGLRAGEQVVDSDRNGLKPGQLVKPQPAAPLVYETAGHQ
jgi:RND family efflux transporter MFP subunit